ncbi:MAG TPA: chaperone modulator CbpM [Bacteroidales bacterium]|nr:chaperone modulator CbpM [Bacteroidales bacterium]
MKNEHMISAAEFCDCHHIEISFIDSLKETGLIEIATIEEMSYIRESQLNDLEKIVRLYYDLDINIEGIDTVINLLQRMQDMQHEIALLKNRLRLYED